MFSFFVFLGVVSMWDESTLTVDDSFLRDIFRYWFLNVDILILSTDIFVTKRSISSSQRA